MTVQTLIICSQFNGDISAQKAGQDPQHKGGILSFFFFSFTRSSQWRHVGSKLANSLSIDYAPGSVIRQEKVIIKMYLEKC